MGTYWTPLVADLFSFCYERDVMMCRSDKNQAYVIEAFNDFSKMHNNEAIIQFYTILVYKLIHNNAY